eukprot:COSAG01_NODE_35185_length_535_cov_3.284404_1_plen_75_part_10
MRQNVRAPSGHVRQVLGAEPYFGGSVARPLRHRCHRRPEAPTGLCNVVVAAARPAARHWLNYRADGWAPSPPHTA